MKGRWGSAGRINLIGTLCLEGEGERLEYSLIEGSCRSVEVKDYLDALTEQAQRESKSCVVVLDNAPFHTARMIREREEEWEARGLRLYRLPSYCSHLNLIKGVWRRPKSFLMPRCFYGSVAELKQTVLHGLRLLELWRSNLKLEILSTTIVVVADSWQSSLTRGSGGHDVGGP